MSRSPRAGVGHFLDRLINSPPPTYKEDFAAWETRAFAKQGPLRHGHVRAGSWFPEITWPRCDFTHGMNINLNRRTRARPVAVCARAAGHALQEARGAPPPRHRGPKDNRPKPEPQSRRRPPLPTGAGETSHDQQGSDGQVAAQAKVPQPNRRRCELKGPPHSRRVPQVPA